jgi:proteasome lid subunit RPN8/RPN11
VELRVPKTVLDQIRAHAIETYPEECCGFLIGRHERTDRIITEARRAQNVSPDSRRSQYRIDNDLTRRTEAEFRVGLLRIVGFYHSHPEYLSVPSETDRRSAWPYYVYAILGLRDHEPSEFTAWRLEDDTQTFAPVAVTIG